VSQWSRPRCAARLSPTCLASDVMAQGRRVELLATAAEDVKRRLDVVERQI
jgi:hypothetical protein